MTTKISTPRSLEEWESLSVNERRVLIAQDILQQIRLENIQPMNGIYFDQNELNPAEFEEFKDVPRDEVKVCQIIDRKFRQAGKTEPCHVCQRGAMMMTALRYKKTDIVFTDLIGNAMDSNHSPERALDDTFSLRELKALESAFEGWGVKECRLVGIPAREDDDFDMDDAAGRMQAINNYIILRNGDITPLVEAYNG